MSLAKITPDDPKLTAYALGELEGEDRAAVEAALRDDPALQAALDEIRAMTEQLTTALASEAALPLPQAKPGLKDAAIVQGRDFRKLDGGPLGKVIQFPQFYYLVGGLAAACFAVFVALRPEPRREMPKTYAELKLIPAAESGSKTIGNSVLVSNEKSRSPSIELPLQSVENAVPQMAEAAAQQVAKAENQVSDQGVATEQQVVSQAALAPQSVQAAPKETQLGLLAQAEEARDRSDPARRAQSFNGKDDVQAAVQARAEFDFGAAGAQDKAPLANARQQAAQSAPGAGPNTLANGVAANPTTTGPAAPAADEEVVTLSPFQVSDGKNSGHLRSNLAAVKKRSLSAQNAPSKIRVSSREFLKDKTASALTDSFRDADMRISLRPATPASNTEAYALVRDNEFLGAQDNPLSTFSIDVDTASYSNLRRHLQNGRLPPPDAVRIEELVNYFPYHYQAPKGDGPFAATMEVAEAPWAPEHRLVRIGLKGREVSTAARPAANLVFLLDVSGSMDEPNKLPLVKESMRLLIGRLRPDDHVAIVVYAGASGLALPSTPVAKTRQILGALDALTPGGSTNGAMGIQLAYDVAKANFVPGGVNRVILCTDGDFNVGVTNDGDLVRLITEKAKSGVFLTALGFGMGNLKDATLEQLADKGNGNYGYIDSRREAEKLLVEQVNGTLLTIAKDVKLQVEFNPAQVASYRLIGYENRLLRKEDFNNDKIDAGEIGAGHTVTALYEVVLAGSQENPAASVRAVDELKYRSAESSKVEARNPNSNELLTLKVRYKQPDGDVSRKLEFPLVDSGSRFVVASADFKFAAAVAEFGMILRDSPHKGTGTIKDVLTWAEEGPDGDAGGYRGEFIELVKQAAALME